jgi:hypothetical protein
MFVRSSTVTDTLPPDDALELPDRGSRLDDSRELPRVLPPRLLPVKPANRLRGSELPRLLLRLLLLPPEAALTFWTPRA